MKLYLHIGTGRTGTQALQDYLKRNAGALRENGFLYPVLEQKNHHNTLALPLCGATPPRYLKTRYGADVEKNVGAFNAYFDLLEQMVQAEQPANVILSSEFLGRAFSKDQGEILFARLRRLFDDIRIIVYFRTPASYYLSAALQTLKASERFNPPFKQTSRKILTSYDPLGATVMPREYNRDVLFEADICKDFIHALAPGLVAKLAAPSRQKNETLSAEVMSIVQDYRAIIWPDATNQFNDETDTLLDRLLKVADANNLYIKPRLKPQIEAALNMPDAEMLWLRDRYGLSFAGIDYDQDRSDKMKLDGDYRKVADICVLDPEIRDRIQIHLLSELNNATLTQRAPPPTRAAPVAKGVKGGPAQKEINRLKQQFDRLRRPEIEHYATPSLIQKTRDTGMVRIRGNFPDVALSDITSWAYNPRKHVVWRIYFNSFAWLAGLVTEDKKTSTLDADWDQVKRLVLLFLDHLDTHANWPKSDIWDDHATGFRASYLAWLYAGGLVDHLSADEDLRLRKAMQLHRTKLMDYLASDRWKFSNHTIFQAEGLADLALVFLSDPTRRDQTLKFAAEKINAFVGNAVTHEEGSVKEHSIFYHVFLMKWLLDTCTYFEEAGYPICAASDEMFTKMNQFLHDVMPTPGRLPGIGDSKHNQRFDKKYVQAYQDDRFTNDRIRYHKTNGQSGVRYRFLTCYPSDGYFIFRSDAPVDAQLYSVFLHRTFRGPHGHWDAGSFVCYRNGHPVLIDSGGPYMYGTKMRFKYFVSALGHNTLIFDQDPVQLTTTFLDSREAEGMGVIALGAEMGQGRYWIRLFAQDRDQALIIVDIPVAASEGHRAETRFHIDPEVSFTPGEAPLLAGPWGRAVFKHSSVALESDLATSVQSALDTGRSEAIQSDRMAPKDRGKDLDADFDQRSYVTYKDNEMHDGLLYQKVVPVGHATLTTLTFDDANTPYALVREGSRLRVCAGEGKAETSVLTFDLRTLTLAP